MSNELCIESSKLDGTTVRIYLSDGTILSFEDCWLRDHCRCNQCYHANTCQRALHILDIPEASVINIDFNKFEIIITWDDLHKSVYGILFLCENDYDRWIKARSLQPVLWKGLEIADKVARVNVNKFLNSIEGEKLVFKSLLDYGVALIEDVDNTEEDTKKVCTALGGVQHTMFGGMWTFTTKADHADTAYTSLGLSAHNDNTYFTEAAGLQILHCLEHTGGTGGQTIIADGFYGATKLKEESPDDFHLLSTYEVESEYIESGYHFRYSAPIIQIDSRTKDLKQIRFNVYDRSAMPLSNKEETRNYYKSLRNLARFYQDDENQWKLKLTPGLVLVVDNFRVLHGRTSFSGKRVISGSYVSRSDWLNRARVLKLIQ